MGKRSRLFASAAFPLLSLSLAFQPVAASTLSAQTIAPVNNDASAAKDGASFEVAQEQAPAGQSEEELKRKKEGEAQQGQKHEAAPAQPGGAEPQHKLKEAQPEAAPAPQKHQQEAPQPKAAEPQAAPKQQQEQPAPKPQHQQNAQPEAKPQPKAAEPQAQEPAQPAPKPHKQPAEQQPAAEPEVKPQPKAAPETQQQGQPEQKPHQKPQAQPAEPAQQTAPAKQPAPAAQQPQSQQAQPETETQPAQKPHQKPQAQPAAPAEQPVAPAQQQKPAAQQTQPETQAQPGTAATPGKQQGQKPDHGKPQQGEQPAAATAQQPAQKAEPQGQQPNPAAPQTGKQQPNTEAGAPAQGGTATPAPANGAAQPGPQTAVPASAPVSQQELERRKKIAENPAESKGPVILPVQNGAAVLDSDKDAARRGHHQGGQNAGGQGGAQGGQQQGQAGQGQNAQTPPPAAYTKPPTSDAEAQRASGGQQQPPVKIEAVTSEQGRRMDARPNFAPPQGTTVQTVINQDNRTIVNVDNTYVVRHDDTERFLSSGERPSYEQLPRDRYRETIGQPDGDRIITVRNRYGDIIQRSRVDADGREYVLFYSPELEQQPDHDDYFRDPGDSLPPMRLLIPLSQYIIDTGTERDSDYYDFLREPPVEPVERIYSINEVRYSARIRDKVRRIDLDTITFATGSAEVPMSQASTLRGVADAIGQIVKKDPTETFLIEGHTDAVGSAESNLILSDQRAESVAKVLSDVYGVPPENLVTQGYGEQYLKVNTQGPEQENRRVTIRRITALVRPVASNR